MVKKLTEEYIREFELECGYTLEEIEEHKTDDKELKDMINKLIDSFEV